MAEVTLRRKKKRKNVRFFAALANFVLAHVKDDEGERAGVLRRRYIATVVRICAGCAFSALISRAQLAFSVYPFGIMFICASGKASALYALSSLISYLTLGGIGKVYAAVCALALLSRSCLCIYFDTKERGTYTLPLYNEWAVWRVIVSCVASFAVGIYNLIYYSFTYYSLLGSVLFMIVCPVGTYIFSVAFDRSAGEELREAARLFECAVLVWSLSGVTLFSLNAGKIAAFCLIASESDGKRKGASALMGLVCGLPFGLSECAVYSLGGAVCATLMMLSDFLGKLGAFTFILMSEGYIGGYSALLGSLPSLTVALCSVLLWQRYDISRRICSFSLYSLAKRSQKEKEAQTEPTEASISEISRAFSSLSATLRSLSRRYERACLLDTSGICERALERVCASCPERIGCREKNASTFADAQANLTTSLSRPGKLTERALPPYIRENCSRKGALISEINRATSQAVERCFRRSGTGRLSSDYASMAKILDAHLCRTQARSEYDRELSSRLLSLSRRKLYGISGISVYGTRHKRIYAHGINLASHTVSAAELQKEFEAICGCALTSPVYTIEGTDIEFEMHTAPRFEVESAIAGLPKENEEQSGDSGRTFSNNEGYFYGVLCDGMGSGEQAAYTSGICAEYLLSMLSCSNPKELTLEMLNSVLRDQNTENSSTVDIFEFDSYSGEGCFLKSGAAPSYVCRGKNVYKVSAKTIPIGITERIGAEKIKFKLRAGDVVLMLSDGLVEDEEEGRLIVETLCRRTTADPFDIAASVLCAAKEKYNMRDDMTVICVAVKGKKE